MLHSGQQNDGSAQSVNVSSTGGCNQHMSIDAMGGGNEHSSSSFAVPSDGEVWPAVPSPLPSPQRHGLSGSRGSRPAGSVMRIKRSSMRSLRLPDAPRSQQSGLRSAVSGSGNMSDAIGGGQSPPVQAAVHSPIDTASLSGRGGTGSAAGVVSGSTDGSTGREARWMHARADPILASAESVSLDPLAAEWGQTAGGSVSSASAVLPRTFAESKGSTI